MDGTGNLLLARRPGESIVLGNELATVDVSELLRDRVRLVVRAPRWLTVHRGEVYRRAARVEEVFPLALSRAELELILECRARIAGEVLAGGRDDG